MNALSIFLLNNLISYQQKSQTRPYKNIQSQKQQQLNLYISIILSFIILLKSTTMQNQTFISCLAWIHRGYAAKVPIQSQIPAQQIQQIKNDPLIHQQLKKQKQQSAMIQQQLMDEQNNQDDILPVFSQGIVQNQIGYPNLIDDLQDEQKQDYYIKDTDALIVCGKIQKQFSSLQVYVYEQQNNNLFVHHQIMLSSFPLSLQWLNVGLGSIGSGSSTKGNYAIVSTFLPQIQIWNLDYAQAIQPDMILGGQIISNKKKPTKFTNKAKKYKQGSHTDSVLTLSLNSTHKNILASGSADTTVKIWDLNQGKNIHTCIHHKSRVNKIKWSPIDTSVIFTASQDKSIAVLDSRYPNDNLSHKLNNKDNMIESACWNINTPTQICYTTDKGNLNIIDVRYIDKLLISFSAHQGHSITDIKIGSKNMCYTCSQDESVRIWDLNKLDAPIGFKKPNCGKMYCLDLMETDDGPILSCGNGKGELFVWDVTENANVENYWKTH